MNGEQAETAITLSALVVTGIFSYRKVVEPGINREQIDQIGQGGKRSLSLIEDYQSVFGARPPIEWGQFLKATGTIYIALAIVGAASPSIGGSAAVLIGTVAVLGNGIAISKDLKAGEATKTEQRSTLETKLATTPTKG